jgi:hypothetical protein
MEKAYAGGGTVTDALQRKMDADSRHGVFEVDANHPAYAVRYCEMCGGEVNAKGECQGDSISEDQQRYLEIIGKLTRYSLRQPDVMAVLGAKMTHPMWSIREVCQMSGVKRDKVHRMLHELAQLFPTIRALFNTDSTLARSQQLRRKKERQQHER